MRKTLLALASIALFAQFGCAKLDVSDNSFAGALTLDGMVVDGLTGFAVTPAGGDKIQVTFGGNTLSGSIRSDGTFSVDGVPANSDIILIITVTGYEVYSAEYSTNGYGTQQMNVGSIGLAPERPAAFTGATFVFEVRDGWGNPVKGTLYLSSTSPLASSLPLALQNYSIALDSSDALTDVSGADLYPGTYDIAILEASDGNDVRLKDYFSTITVNDISLYYPIFYSRSTASYPAPSSGTLYLNASTWIDVDTRTPDPEACMQVELNASTKTFSITYTFPTPVLLNYFNNLSNQLPNLNVGINGSIYDCFDGVSDWDFTGNNVTVIPATISTVPSATVEIKVDSITTVGNAACGVYFTNVSFYLPGTAGAAFSPDSLFLTPQSGLLNTPGCAGLTVGGGPARSFFRSVILDLVD